MPEFLLLSIPFTGPARLLSARRLADEEKFAYSQDVRELMFVPLEDAQEVSLPLFRISEAPARPCDGALPGGCNQAWIIDRAEWERPLGRERRRELERRRRDLTDRLQSCRYLQECARRQLAPYASGRRECMRALRRRSQGTESGAGRAPHFFAPEDLEQYEAEEQSLLEELEALEREMGGDAME